MANRKIDFYWKNYISAADVACRAAEYLLECMREYDIGNIGKMLARMHEFEHEGDSLRHEMTEALAKSFVTPIEREDMQELSQRLDRVIDIIEEVLQSIYFNCINKLSAESILFAEKICICTAKMKEMLVALFFTPIVNVVAGDDFIVIVTHITCSKLQAKRIFIAWRLVMQRCHLRCRHNGHPLVFENLPKHEG